MAIVAPEEGRPRRGWPRAPASVPLADPLLDRFGRFGRIDRSRRIDHTVLMRFRLGRALVVTALLALSSPWAAGWAVALHLATDAHGGRASSYVGGVLGLQLAAHGHVHAENTPAHTHPALGSVAAPIPGRRSMPAPAMTGDAPEAVLTAASNSRLAAPAGPNHDPPPRGVSVSILRI